MTKNSFSDKVCQEIGYYVYRLIDPRNGDTFYVGRGQGNRVFQHAQGEIKELPDDEDNGLSQKQGKILEIRNAGLDVIHVIHRHGIKDIETVKEVEAALIDAYPGLSNIQGGTGSGDRGPMNHVEINNKYALPELEENPPHSLILININSLEVKHDRRVIYNQVRYHWRLSVNRARKAEYVLQLSEGLL